MSGQEIPSKKRTLARNDIIDALSRELVKRDYIQAFWEGGAAAWGRVDEWSDIDAYLLVDDQRVHEAFEAVETVLRSLSPIRQKYLVSKNWPGVTQAFYSLEHASEYLVLDLGILTTSSQEKFLETEIHGTSIFYFNKQGLNQTPKADIGLLEKKSADDMVAVRERFRMFSNFVEKEIMRGNSLEALENYRTIVIPCLVQALRAKHTSAHHDFRMRYIHYELPNGAVKKLEDLCFVSDMKDLKMKNAKAIRWFNELAS